MADDLDELGRRLDRIEHALRRPPEASSRTPSGPDIRSPRSIVKRVQADSSALPVASGSVAVIALVNMLLFPAEVDCALTPGGVLLW